ncbi:Enoyl-CoA hydratase / 3-hydroxyacyl-CoA dehydrogenase / 3-hydroxybutyryl-CoA epimerase [hydrothermal vent metagenome]|uniref:enoyl-CoA hydratase n=1 Tax=hydrothermal vent metagenome TaxID=652676 RepID=A0A3B0ZB07_9ZZZZ
MSEQKVYQHWRKEQESDGIIWLYIDKAESKANVLSRAVIEELDALLEEIEGDKPAGVVITSGKSSGFIAGADVNEFTTLQDQDDGFALVRRAQAVFDRLEALHCPTVALIQGFCLGGGMELVLACDYRIAVDDPKTKLGLPEVKLGIHPGFGGTVRLPPLIGAPAAMDLMLSGRALSAKAAAKVGVVDHAVPERHKLTAASQLLKQKPARKKATGWRAWSNNGLLRPLLAGMMRRKLAKKARQDHYPAPYAVIDLWEKYGSDPKVMMKEEATSVARLVMGDTAQNLIRLFFLQERMKGLGSKSDFKAERVHVIGGGVMGGDIAAWCAMQGLEVTLQDRSHEVIARAIGRAHGLFKKKLKHPLKIRDAMDRLIPDIEGRGIAGADVIIEAIFENVEAKQQLFKELESKARPDALLATNTSSIPLETISEVLDDPSRLIGLHFFNPVAQMQLVEIVRGAQSNEALIDAGCAFTKQIGRLPLPVKSSPGFLVNRILMPYLIEAVVLVSEGVPAVLIDQAATKFGMPMGPIELADTVGLDICLHVAEILSQELGGEVPEKLRTMVAAGQLGRKSGEGFYQYKKGKPVKPSDTGTPPPDDLTDRMILRFVNEAMACLREGVVEDGDLLDAGIIFGTGFAPFRGGPMNYTAKQGHEQLKSRLDHLQQAHGDRFVPDTSW